MLNAHFADGFSLKTSTNEFSTMAEISANGKGSQAGWVGHAWTGWQGGQTILKHSSRLSLVCTVMASFISRPHEWWLFLYIL